MPDRKSFYITTAISYPNGAPHIGHAYEAVATDAIARFKRLDGYDVFFMTGVDEHGLKMTQTAAKEGLTPAQLSDRNVPLFEAMCDRLAVMKGARGGREPPYLLGDAVHVNGKADAAVANQGEAQFLFPHEPGDSGV